jgi:hypothetical protein
VKLPYYSRTVDVVTESPRPGVHRQAHDIEYIVDVGPPIRLAFPKDGIIDNWRGVVYDPTDVVARAQGFSAPAEITALFGGDLVSCRHLYRHYYFCGFT